MDNQDFHQITDNRMYWFNYVRLSYEYIETPTDFTEYILQDTAAQGLYRCHLQMGKTPIDAAMEVFRVCVGEAEE